MAIRVLIADDHAIVRAGLRTLITSEKDLELIGEATGGLEAIEKVHLLSPDVLVLDISMPDKDCIEVIRTLKEEGETCAILVLTVHEDDALLREAIRIGAAGYILKHAAESELISAIRSVFRGELYIHPKMIRTLLQPEVSTPVKEQSMLEKLTSREEEVLKLIVQGYTNKQVADELGISVRTVEGHRANLTDKLGIRSRVDLLRYAREHHII
jgi:two-component system, NarL family, response regulator NreC